MCTLIGLTPIRDIQLELQGKLTQGLLKMFNTQVWKGDKNREMEGSFWNTILSPFAISCLFRAAFRKLSKAHPLGSRLVSADLPIMQHAH